MRLAYTVHAEIDSPELAAAWIAWLEPHVREVLAAGAAAVQVVRLDGEAGATAPVRIEARYLFASREAFAAYEREHAPRLRADGMAKFPPERGVRLRRSLGDLLLALP